MPVRRTRSCSLAVALLISGAALSLGFSGSDLFTCHIGGNQPGAGFINYGEASGVRAYAVMTHACNQGDQGVSWDDEAPEPDNAHPVISTNMFRLRDGRFEHLGQAWLKHGFSAAQNDGCTTCQPGGTPHLLGPGCCDVYGVVLNGNQFALGPKSDVNPVTVSFPYPYCSPADGSMACPPADQSVVNRRLQVKTSALDPSPDVLYFIEVMYLNADDSLLANPRTDFNNASYRRVSIAANGDLLAWQSDTIKYEPAIRAWKLHGLGPDAVDADVHEVNIDIPEDGRFWIASKASQLDNGNWQYEYAVHNYNSDRAGQSFRVPIPTGALVTELGFHDVDYHSGEPYSLTNWTPTVSQNEIAWQTATFAQDPNANALRWGTLYNFRFISDLPPGSGPVTIDLFKPGTPSSITATSIIPMLPLGATVPSQTQAGLKARYYALTEPAALPDFGAIDPYLGETVAEVNFPPTFGNFAGSGAIDDVGALFEGYILIPQDGAYTFFSESDDGSAIYIDDLLIVDNDGLHALQEKAGAVSLQAGLHRIRIEYFEGGGSAALIARYQGPGLTKQIIPPGVLFRNIPADVNDSGNVDVDDLLVIINGWGACKVPPAACEGDISGDGTIDVDDLLAVINNWG